MRKKNWLQKVHDRVNRLNVIIYILIFTYLVLHIGWLVSLCILGIHVSHAAAYYLGKHKQKKHARFNIR